MAPGLLARSAWQALEDATVVLALDPDSEQCQALQHPGVQVQAVAADVAAAGPRAVARVLVESTRAGSVLWVSSPDGDPGLTDAVAAQAAELAQAPEIEVVFGSWDVPGARLLDAVAVMDRLRSPGGCPWDAQQTHQSLLPYLVEEAHEFIEAVESGERSQLQDELGDLLLQVLFHARVAADDADEPFDVDAVAGGLVEKLVRRHPHVFADRTAADAAEVEANWEQIKAAEKPERSHPLDGIPLAMPDLARAAKVVSRLERAGAGQWLQEWLADRSGAGAAVLRLVQQAADAGTDLPADVRAELRLLRDELPWPPAAPGTTDS